MSALFLDLSSSSSESSSDERAVLLYKVITVDEAKYLFEAAELKQNNLTSSGVYLLDDGSTIYVWFGKAVPNEVVKTLFQIGDAYKLYKEIPKGQQPVLGLKQGFEPRMFKAYFVDWNVNKFPDQSERHEMLKTNKV